MDVVTSRRPSLVERPGRPGHGRTPRATVSPLAVLRARWPLLLVGFLLGAVTGVVAMPLLPASAVATSTVRLGPGLAPMGELAPTPMDAGDAVALARTRPLLEDLAEDLGVSVGEAEDQLEVTERGGSSYVDFRYTDATPTDAARAADAAAAGFLDAVRSDAAARLESRQVLMRASVQSAPSWRVPQLREDLQDLEQTVVDAGAVVQPAAGTAAPRGAGGVVWLSALGALGGLLVAGGAAYLLEARSPRLRASRPVSVPGVRDLGSLDAHASVGVAGVATMLGVGRRLGDAQDDGSTVLLAVDVMAPGRDDLIGVVRRQLAEVAPDLGVRVVPVDLGSADGLSRVASCDGILLVGVEGSTRVQEIHRTVSRLDFVDAPCFGIATVASRRWALTA